MFGMSIEEGLKMLKPHFEKKGIKSIVLHLNHEGNVTVQEYKENIIDLFKDLMANCPEAKKYLTEKK